MTSIYKFLVSLIIIAKSRKNKVLKFIILITMELKEALSTVYPIMLSKPGRSLNDAETVLFKGSWQDLIYDDMVKDTPLA